jgi:valyl-tRNA synthetase
MSSDFNKPYNAKEVEEKIYRLWEKSGCFKPRGKGQPFCAVIPPPNITGSLHMGHALNATIQDILVRKRRMEGYKTIWIPGTDHAGIATQNVVEKQLKKQGLSRHDLGREKFIEKVWEWKEKYGGEILDQLKKIGASCDWSEERFTMDEKYQEWVKKAFLHYQQKGMIYRAERVINWCPRCQTSLSDLELEYKKEDGKLWYIKYPLKEKSKQETPKYIVVATTRPETMLGDTAVAVHPGDKRYQNLIGKKAILPIVEKEIPIIADRHIDREFGTGALKVTPAHSIIDAEIGQEHKLNAPKVIDQTGKMIFSAKGGSAFGGEKYKGLPIKKAREKIVKELQEKNLIEKTEDYKHNIATCYRCGKTVENLPSKQWFLKMDQLAKKAIRAVESKEVVFYPRKWERVYLDWLRNVKDWCISRQIWWGHKIPIKGESDVLDTWFSSALWPVALTDKKNLKEFYPTNVLSTARDIINLWVARMVFSGLEFRRKKPFKDVIIHPTILTKTGKRMSKSLGTGIDPMTYVKQYGADATRFGLIWQMMGNQDIHWAEEHVIAGKKFCNKIWNISRFVLAQIGNSKSEIPNSKQIQNSNDQILKHLNKLIESNNKNIAEYKFGQALHELYDFIWHEFADNYIEYSKTKNDETTKKVLAHILSESLKLLHPFMPFITEEIWSRIPPVEKELLIVTKYPSIY